MDWMCHSDIWRRNIFDLSQSMCVLRIVLSSNTTRWAFFKVSYKFKPLAYGFEKSTGIISMRKIDF